jgi:predicted phage gp36 major capsid-like protein
VTAIATRRRSTLAIAYQFVVGRGQPLEFTEAGLERLAEIREQFEELERDFENLTNDEIRARTDAYAADTRDILDNELVPAGDNQGNGPPIDREETDEIACCAGSCCERAFR